MSEAVLRCEGLGRVYEDGDRSVAVLEGIDFELPPGDKVAVVGASGSGKSTLLNLLGGLDRPSSGRVMIHGQDLQQLDEPALCHLRNTQLGFVYQFHHLLPEFDALENVAMPLLIGGVGRSEAWGRATQLLERVGMAHRSGHRPAQLSGGERQRVAIARALVANPACVLMDEPTGNLDPKLSREIMNLLAEFNAVGVTTIIATHDIQLAKQMQRRMVVLHQGKLIEAGIPRSN